MKKNIKILLLVFICMFAVISSGMNVHAATKYKIAYKSSYTNSVLQVGKKKRVYVVSSGKTVTPSKITWNSSNKKVATVKNGLITAKGYGTTYISAQMKNSSSNKIRFLLRVYETKQDVSFKSLRNPYVIEVGKSKKIVPTIKETYWKFSSSNTNIVSVAKNGKLTAKKNGTAKITYVSVGKYYCKRTVKVIVGKRMTAVESGVNNDSLVLIVGDTYTIKPIAVPETAVLKKFEYYSNAKKIATVNSAGVISAKKAGTAKIRVRAKDSSAKYVWIKVTVVEKDSGNSSGSVGTKVIAHRGLASQAPENSLPAFELAGKNGFNAIECDVRVTKDGEIVVMHDASLQRMCGVNKNISDITLDEIKKYPIIAGTNADKYPNNLVPTLDEFIQCCNQYMCIPVVEIKGNFTAAQLEKVYSSIKKSAKPPVVISFYRYNLRWLRKKDANLQLQNVAWEASEYELKFCREIKADMSAQYINLTADQVKRIQAEGIKVATWNINDLSTFNYFKNMGIDYISTEVDFI